MYIKFFSRNPDRRLRLPSNRFLVSAQADARRRTADNSRFTDLP